MPKQTIEYITLDDAESLGITRAALRGAVRRGAIEVFVRRLPVECYRRDKVEAYVARTGGKVGRPKKS